jgi:hypothetical protein
MVGFRNRRLDIKLSSDDDLAPSPPSIDGYWQQSILAFLDPCGKSAFWQLHPFRFTPNWILVPGGFVLVHGDSQHGTQELPPPVWKRFSKKPESIMKFRYFVNTDNPLINLYSENSLIQQIMRIISS